MHHRECRAGHSRGWSGASFRQGRQERETGSLVKRQRARVCVPRLRLLLFHVEQRRDQRHFACSPGRVIGGWPVARTRRCRRPTLAAIVATYAVTPARLAGKVTTSILASRLWWCPHCSSRALRASPAIIYVWVALFGIGMATVSLTVYPMFVELASANDGTYTGFYYACNVMSAQVVDTILWCGHAVCGIPVPLRPT